MLRVSVPINLDCEHLVLSFWMAEQENDNLCNHQANRRVGAAVSPTNVFKNTAALGTEPNGFKSSATQCRLWWQKWAQPH